MDRKAPTCWGLCFFAPRATRASNGTACRKPPQKKHDLHQVGEACRVSGRTGINVRRRPRCREGKVGPPNPTRVTWCATANSVDSLYVDDESSAATKRVSATISPSRNVNRQSYRECASTPARCAGGLTKRQRTQSVKGDKVWVDHKQVENVRRLIRGNR
jgi:hypothetical protein